MIEHYKNRSLENIENEIWIPVSGYEELYSVSSFGRIKSLASNKVHIWSCGRKYQSRKTDRILAQKKHNRGYKMICLTNAEVKKYTSVHRLVAEMFIPNSENKRTVNHKNGIKWDNRVENLEWATDSENGIHSFRELGRRRAKTFLGKFGKEHNRSKPVLQFNLNGNFIREWENAQQISRELGLAASNISSCCNRSKGNNQFGGFLWKFSNDDKPLVKSSLNKPIIQLSKNGAFIKEYKSLRQIAKETGFDRSHIGKSIKNKRTAYEFNWIYK